jgi:tRNA pseudouridine32 synthase / 23S rRNA pseudouridine746 synthase
MPSPSSVSPFFNPLASNTNELALGRTATEQLMSSLRAGELAPGLSSSILYGADGGKMFGTLVVRSSDGRLGFLKAFSGQLEHRWDIEGFVPPLFNRAAREATEPRGEALVRALTARVIEAQTSQPWAELRVAVATLGARHAAEERELAQRHAQNREQRRSARTGTGNSHALDRGARDDETEHRRLKTRLREERAPLEAALARFERRLLRLKRWRVTASRISSWQLYDTYLLENALEQKRSLRDLFAPRAPPSGAGDCAAPKLVSFALRHQLQPLQLTEFWWGKPPRGGGRVEGTCYPPCEEKCATLLPFLLKGIELVL